MGREQANDSKTSLGRIFVVEDDPILAMACEDTLLEAGASEVIICPSIACTMEQLEHIRPDAIVLDVHLADRDDGWALAELVDQLGPKRPRIIFSTGSPEDIPPDIARMGVLLEKPYAPEDLMAALQSHSEQGLFARLRSVLR
ncbi:response regulator [Altericroceibacterium endophyticum]|uniref:Response regulator n=1 Tax=Altericroceibacterium endophyticum TaxID=1808508 RepID=A0A6I4T484_9SPHN|nr:response regulator [Altericroceibacterium endophyticum]MXO65042.1 response regulator [Altericroceibacterium endophyticum]